MTISPVSLYAVCTDGIELVLSSDPVVMGTIKQKCSSHDISHDTVRHGVSIILSYIVLDTSICVG